MPGRRWRRCAELRASTCRELLAAPSACCAHLRPLQPKSPSRRLTTEISSSASATLSGTPTAAGTYDFALQVSDGTQTATQAFQVAVAPQALPVVDSVTYAASGGKQNNKNLVVTVGITRGGSPLANASVSITLRRNGAVYATRVGTTGANGTVAFSFSNYAKGCYVTTVTQVVVSGQASTPSTPANSHCK